MLFIKNINYLFIPFTIQKFVKYFFFITLIPTVKPQLFFEIKAELDPTLGEFAPSFTTMTEMVKKIYKMVLDDGRLKVRELADKIGRASCRERV